MYSAALQIYQKIMSKCNFFKSKSSAKLFMTSKKKRSWNRWPLRATTAKPKIWLNHFVRVYTAFTHGCNTKSLTIIFHFSKQHFQQATRKTESERERRHMSKDFGRSLTYQHESSHCKSSTQSLLWPRRPWAAALSVMERFLMSHFWMLNEGSMPCLLSYCGFLYLFYYYLYSNYVYKALLLDYCTRYKVTQGETVF